MTAHPEVGATGASIPALVAFAHGTGSPGVALEWIDMPAGDTQRVWFAEMVDTLDYVGMTASRSTS
jgi:hypothetical protein